MPRYTPLLSGFPQPPSIFTIQSNGTGASLVNTLLGTPLSGLYLINQSKADNLGVQLSPPITWEGSGLNTTTNGPKVITFRSYIQPVSAATNPTANWILESSVGGGPFNRCLTIDNTGNLYTGTPTGGTFGTITAASGIFNSPSGFNMILAPAGTQSIILGTVAAATTFLTINNKGNSTNVTTWTNGSNGVIAQMTNSGWLSLGGSTPASVLNVISGAIGTTFTTSSGIFLQNRNTSTGSAQQISPPLVWEGQGWATTGSGASMPVDFAAYVLPVQGTVLPTSEWHLQSSISGSVFTDVMKITNSGSLTISNLQIKAGTNLAAPIGLVSGSLLTTPLSGSIEFDNTHFYGTIGSTRYPLDQQVPAAMSSGQTTLVAGTKAITVTGTTTSSKAFISLVSPSNTSLTTIYQGVCTSNTITIQANIAAGTINTADTSVVNYLVIF